MAAGGGGAEVILNHFLPANKTTSHILMPRAPVISWNGLSLPAKWFVCLLVPVSTREVVCLSTDLCLYPRTGLSVYWSLSLHVQWFACTVY
jgi:hypothetical protein